MWQKYDKRIGRLPPPLSSQRSCLVACVPSCAVFPDEAPKRHWKV